MLRSPCLATAALSLCLLAAGASPALAGKPIPANPAKVVGQAQNIEVVPNLSTAGRTADGQRAWGKTVTVNGAAFLKPRFANVNLRPGDVLVVRSASGKVVEEITLRGPENRGSFWGLSAFGDTLHLELRFQKPYERTPFRISQVMVGDPAMLAEAAGVPQPRSICSPGDFEDVICYDADVEKWANVLASVGVMTAGGNVSLWCSGSTVSPQGHVLTNEHCIANQSECSNAEFVYKYYRTGCNNGSAVTQDWEGFRCDQTVASSPFNNLCDPNLDNLDYSLHTVVGDASAYGFVEVDPTPLTSGEAIYIVQHPSGRPHEIAHGDGANVVVDPGGNGTTLRYYDTLDTEGGSSGSPIFRDSDDKLVGLHHCGGCSTPGVGNRGMMMSEIYPEIEQFLCSQSLNLVARGAQNPVEVSGNGDAVIDPGETWSIEPTVRNVACSDDATSVEADLGVGASSVNINLIDTVTTFGNIDAGGLAVGTPVQFQVDVSIPCSGQVIIDLLNISDAAATYPGLAGIYAGDIGSVPVNVFEFQDFTGGGIGAWTVVDGGTGTGDAQTWTTADPEGRNLLTPPFIIADSDALGNGNTMDEELISQVIDVTGFSNVTLQFDHNFRWYNAGGDEQADVDVRSSATGGAWTNLVNYSGGDAAGTVTLDLTPYAAADLQIRFHYYNAEFDWWWALDDVYVQGDDGPVCQGAEVIFGDGFESADTLAWSSQVVD
ncbi:MAG: trypsin-like peptidase domain-containing protein [Acidobacteriota bacterium]